MSLSWDEAAARMDRDVDARLGDSISYSTDGSRFVDVRGFVIPDGAGIGTDDDGTDYRYGDLGGTVMVKMLKTLIPGGPKTSHRIKSPKLGAEIYQPAGDSPSDQGRYYMFPVQKARK